MYRDKKADLTGRKFGKWLVKGPSSSRKKTNQKFWDCVCECGVEQQIPRYTLEQGLSQNCRACRPRLGQCVRGHELTDWGRSTSGSCRACIKHKSLLREYGVTLEEFERLWKFQNGKCALCGEPIALFSKGAPGWHFDERRPEVDHNHEIADKKSSVRGILCGGQWAGCNRRLGKVDDLDWLLKAVDYLQHPPAQQLFAQSEN